MFCSLILLVSLLSTPQVSAANENINAEMQAMIDAGIITGYSDGTYRPNANVTRGQFAVFLYRALNLEEGPHVFSDVSRNSALATGINATVKAGIVTGFSDNTFKPNQNITRVEMAVMIDRALDYAGATKTKGTLSFTDEKQIVSSSFRLAVMNMVGMNIINGYPDGSFKPTQAATRQHAAAFISRMLTALKEQGINLGISTLNAFEQEVFRLVNIERAKMGLNALTIDMELSKVARLKSQDMKDNNYFGHTSPTFGSPSNMLKQFGISYKAAGENIARGQTTPEMVVASWMNSSGHRANILSANYTHIGVGYVANGNYWTQIFVGR